MKNKKLKTILITSTFLFGIIIGNLNLPAKIHAGVTDNTVELITNEMLDDKLGESEDTEDVDTFFGRFSKILGLQTTTNESVESLKTQITDLNTKVSNLENQIDSLKSSSSQNSSENDTYLDGSITCYKDTPQVIVNKTGSGNLKFAIAYYYGTSSQYMPKIRITVDGKVVVYAYNTSCSSINSSYFHSAGFVEESMQYNYPSTSNGIFPISSVAPISISPNLQYTYVNDYHHNCAVISDSPLHYNESLKIEIMTNNTEVSNQDISYKIIYN